MNTLAPVLTMQSALQATAFKPSFAPGQQQCAQPALKLATHAFVPPSFRPETPAPHQEESTALFQKALPSLSSLLSTTPFMPATQERQPRKKSQDVEASQTYLDTNEQSESSSTKHYNEILRLQHTKKSDLCWEPPHLWTNKWILKL